MKNVYDILVNFKNSPYEFYDWNKEDDIKHVKKIPSFKVCDKTLKQIIDYEFVLEKEIMEKIKNQTEIFINRKSYILKYALIAFNDDLAIALIFNDKGIVMGKSKLLFDEEDDVIKCGKNLEVSNIKIKLLNKIHNNLSYTRNENKDINLLKRYIKYIYDDNKNDELQYIYYDCFNKKENDKNVIYKNIIESIEKLDFTIIRKIKEYINLIKNV